MVLKALKKKFYETFLIVCSNESIRSFNNIPRTFNHLQLKLTWANIVKLAEGGKWSIIKRATGNDAEDFQKLYMFLRLTSIPFFAEKFKRSIKKAFLIVTSITNLLEAKLRKFYRGISRLFTFTDSIINGSVNFAVLWWFYFMTCFYCLNLDWTLFCLLFWWRFF